jgi:hypothetical protein
MARPFSRRAMVAAAVVGATVAAISACVVPESSASTGGGSTRPPSPADSTRPPSPAEVEQAHRQLDERAASAPSSVVSWGVDPALGLVVVRVTGRRTAEVDRFLSGIDPRTLRVVTDAEPVRPLPKTF